MKYLEYILMSYFILYPLYILFTHKSEQLRVINQQESKISVYQQTMLYLWAPLILLMVVVFLGDLSLKELGLVWQWNMRTGLALLFLFLLATYFLISLKSLIKNCDQHPKLREQYEFVRWLLPATSKEANYFIFGLAITAGICEELLFRGYLIQLVSNDFPTYIAVIISSILFGLGHIYQGAVHVIRTAILGFIMALIYLVTESIIIPIILHIMLDMYGGAVAYIIFSDKKSEA